MRSALVKENMVLEISRLTTRSNVTGLFDKCLAMSPHLSILVRYNTILYDNCIIEN